MKTTTATTMAAEHRAMCRDAGREAAVVVGACAGREAAVQILAVHAADEYGYRVSLQGEGCPVAVLQGEQWYLLAGRGWEPSTVEEIAEQYPETRGDRMTVVGDTMWVGAE